MEATDFESELVISYLIEAFRHSGETTNDMSAEVLNALLHCLPARKQ